MVKEKRAGAFFRCWVSLRVNLRVLRWSRISELVHCLDFRGRGWVSLQVHRTVKKSQIHYLAFFRAHRLGDK
jgi:hypothetical protein